MPELPEVEGFRRRLAPLIVGRRLAQLRVLDEKLWLPAAGLTAGAVSGRPVQALERRAKLQLFRLEGALCLILHLKIAGQLVYVTPDGERAVGGHPYPLPDADLPGPATRFVLSFQEAGQETGGGGGAECGTLYVNDQRRFAWLRLLPEPEVEAFIAAQHYGPDPLAPDFTPAVLGERLCARRGRPVKAALLDQTCVAGLGNIYANEALHLARIHPMVRAGSLDAAAVARLHGAIRGILEVAVPVGGAAIRAGRVLRVPAEGRDFLHAHGKAGEVCPECAAAGRLAPDGQAPRIVRELLAGRGTYFCPVCQPYTSE